MSEEENSLLRVEREVKKIHASQNNIDEQKLHEKVSRIISEMPLADVQEYLQRYQRSTPGADPDLQNRMAQAALLIEVVERAKQKLIADKAGFKTIDRSELRRFAEYCLENLSKLEPLLLTLRGISWSNEFRESFLTNANSCINSYNQFSELLRSSGLTLPTFPLVPMDVAQRFKWLNDVQNGTILTESEVTNAKEALQNFLR